MTLLCWLAGLWTSVSGCDDVEVECYDPRRKEWRPS